MKNRNNVKTVLKSYQKYVEMEKKIANPDILLFRTCQSDFIEIVYELYRQPSYIQMYTWPLWRGSKDISCTFIYLYIKELSCEI